MYFVLSLCAELLLGVLAVFGLYTLLRGLLLPASACLALEITDGTAPEEIPLLLARARDACLLGGSRVIVLLHDTQQSDTELLEALWEAGAEIYFVQ